jgi:LuxR family transcriptional activator of bioluminescence operon
MDNNHRDDCLFMIGQFFCRALADRFALLPQQEISLTDREVECLYWTSVGKTTEEIALIIGRATQTVRFHLESASKKLGAVNRASAVAQACSRGFINPH